MKDNILKKGKDNILKKIFDKCKVVHSLREPKNLMPLLSKPKVKNSICEKYGFHRYECKDSHYNLCASYVQDCSSFNTSNRYNGK